MRTIHGLTSQPAPLTTDELPLWSGSTTKKVTVADIVAAADPKPHTHDLSDITDAGSAAAASTSDFDTAGAAAAVYSALGTHAAMSTSAHGGIVASTDARLTDSRQCNNSFDTASTARTNLGLGSAALSASGDFDAAGAASAVNSSLTTHGNLTTSAHGGVVASTDARLTDSRKCDNTFVAAATARTNLGLGTAALSASGDFDAAGAASAVSSSLSTHAALTTTAHGGIVASSDARLTDARTPTSHASTHQNSGSDEIATATAAANAIPKAGSGSTLAIGWFPTGATVSTLCIGNDSRLSDSRQCNNSFDSASTARTNLGLGTAALSATGDFDAAGAASAVNSSLTTHGNLTTTAHGGVVASSDARLTDTRTPADLSVTNAKVSTTAAIIESKLSLNFATHSNANDPASGEKSALAGTSGTPGSGNKYVTDGDSRNTNSRQCNNSFDTASTARGNLGLGSAALAATGDFDAAGAASAVNSALTTHGNLTTTAHGGIVSSSDARLTDARTPTSHASSHAAAGSDPLTLSESQVTNLTSDLAAKAALASPTLTGTPAAPTAAADTSTTQIATTAFASAAVAAGVLRTPAASVSLPSDHSLIILRRCAISAALFTRINTNSILRVQY
jgi:hypothetical protein